MPSVVRKWTSSGENRKKYLLIRITFKIKLKGFFKMINETLYNLNIQKTKNRIETLYYQTAGACYLSFSGGKDSTVALAPSII